MRFLENYQNHRDTVEQWLPGPWKTGEYRELSFNRNRTSVLQTEKNTRDRLWQWLYIINIFSKTELYTYKMVKMINCILPQ